jgi:hypothetical protein
VSLMSSSRASASASTLMSSNAIPLDERYSFAALQGPQVGELKTRTLTGRSLMGSKPSFGLLTKETCERRDHHAKDYQRHEPGSRRRWELRRGGRVPDVPQEALALLEAGLIGLVRD